LWDDEYLASKRAWFHEVLALLQPRTKTLLALPVEGRFFFDPSDALDYDPAGVKKHLRGDATWAALRALSLRWAELPHWDAGPLETELRDVAEKNGLAGGALIHPVRLAVTGRTASPGLFDVVAVLGRERTLARIGRLLGRHESGLL
jgi:glutamyl/glutaminyl-tRNA synthetase